MFDCTGIFIMSVEHVLHIINSFWNFYYIINFLTNKYYRGTSVPSQQKLSYVQEKLRLVIKGKKYELCMIQIMKELG